jgi:methyl-accepting chemotaxis protein
VATDEAGSTGAIARIEAGRAVVGQQIEDLQQGLRSFGPSGVQVATDLGDKSSGIFVSLVKFGRIVHSHNIDMARAQLSGTVQPRIDALSQSVDKALALQSQLLAQARQDGERASRLAFDEIGVALACAVALAVALACQIARGVTRPVHAAVQLAERIAKGDLRESLVVARTDEFGRLNQALSTMQRNLGQLVGDIRDVAGEMTLVSAEVASGSDDLSHRTEHAASKLQVTAGSMAELTSRVRDNAESARDADAMARGTAEMALRGGDAVSQVVRNMTDISEASRRIADITTVIDGISFQTNILALNAAVEAARAGEHGRGFAVVAAEVRSLAQRAAIASREIKALIAASVDRIDSGCRLVQTAGGTMKEVVNGAQSVTGIIACISTASDQPSVDLDRVNDTVCQLDEMTQQNSALVEQSSAAAQSMRDQSMRLLEMMKVFRTDGHGTR